MAGAASTNKRRLVSLHDANEIAKRLASAQQKRTKTNEARSRRRRYEDSGSVGDAEEKEDPVSRWMETAKGFRKWDLEKFEKSPGEWTPACDRGEDARLEMEMQKR